MPTVAGTKTSDLLNAFDVYTSENVDTPRAYLGPLYPNKGVRDLLEDEQPIIGPMTWGDTAPQSWTVAGTKARDFGEDWYFRYHIIPTQLDLGNILSASQREIVSWNAFFDQRTLSTANVLAGQGVQLVLPPGVTIPYEVKALEQLKFQLNVSLSGPPSIDNRLRFTIEGFVFDIPITGRRIVLFPFSPDWRSPMDETFSAKSWVLEAADGDEQTGSNWGSHLRRTLEYSVTLTDRDQQTFENLLYTWSSRFFGVPHWAEDTVLDVAVNPGGLVLTFDTEGRSFEPGGFLVLYNSPYDNEIREIADVDGDTVTLSTGVLTRWEAGTKIYPCFVGLMPDTNSGAYETSRVLRAPVAFEMEPSATMPNVAQEEVPETYRGVELYMGPMNWRGPVPFSYTSGRTKIDANTGKFSVTASNDFARAQRQHQWVVDKPAAGRSFRAWLGRRQGRAVPCYMPSGREDFTVTSVINPGDLTIDVEENYYSNLVASHPARRDIIVELWDGTYYPRRIVGSAQIVGGGIRLQLDTSLGVAVDPDDIKRVSMLNLYRLAGDEVTLRWLTDRVGTAETNLVVKKNPD